MKKSDMEFLVDKGIDIVEATKMGYAEIKTPDGKSLWITEKPPLNPAMVADFYQFTMMAAYIESGKADEIATFNGFYRRNPFGGGFTLAVGLERIIEYLEQFQFTGRDIDHMRKHWKMPKSFYEYIREAKFDGTLEALPEGTMAQPYIPMVQLTGTLPIANFVETYILNKLGFPTLVTTKAARIYLHGKKPYLEFGLRRAQGGDEGGLMASRAAYIGGAFGTSNVSAEIVHGIPAKGTHAHSFVEAFPTQKNAFRSYADVFGEESVFLIDTYGYSKGVEDAVTVAKEKGLKTFSGVRDDSGDLAYQSRIIRKILDDNGFKDAKITVSNDIDERIAKSLIEQGAEIDLYGIGTKLVTADGSPSLGIVYKLVQIGDRYAIKISGNEEKITDPGRKNVYRLLDKNGHYAADVMLTSDEILEDEILEDEITVHHRSRGYETKKFNNTQNAIPLLATIFENGVRTYRKPTLDEIKHRALSELDRLWPEITRLENPAEYLVGLSPHLKKIKDKMIQQYAIKK
ncbi:MAG: nicotinate phosphoribosyltransferase [Candidatus Aenigmatarchaeota archaeon]